jgi:UDP-N-acetylglucosamine--N-acetylmuramyl-(pentapeptide) pyrophosphoryl-undecaprenol N-acetylglucosamine transferase
MSANSTSIRVAIACGGTGGHLFPGLAVARQLVARSCGVTLLVSPKEVDQQAAKTVAGMTVVTLPAVGLERGRLFAFSRGFAQSFFASRRLFRGQPHQVALAMGGFTSAPPILAAKLAGALTFLHESNSIPGRANRWLSRVVDQAFAGFPSAVERLHCEQSTVTGTPVRGEIERHDPADCRVRLGLHPARPAVLVVGGSQGASGLNDLVLRALPLLAKASPEWQWIHLTGGRDLERVQTVYDELKLKAVVRGFCPEMDLALGAATAAVSRAGASALAELAAMRLPAVLVPFPAATDNHQYHNAHAFELSGAARLLAQDSTDPKVLAQVLTELVNNGEARVRIQRALAQWHAPQAAGLIAETMLHALSAQSSRALGAPMLKRRHATL